MNCVLYARVSTDKQAEKDFSIPAQLQAMREHARREGWTVIKEFIEPGASAKTAQRPELQKLLSLLKESETQADVVLVHKIDRLARNVYDHATIKALLHQKGIRLASVVENVDDSVPGQLVENIMASIAQFYSGNLSEEVKKGMRQKVLKGGWPHLPPRGYIHVRADGARASRVEVHPKDGPLIRSAFETYATGWHSLKTLAALLDRQGLSASNGRPLAPAQIKRMLSNPFYKGRIHWNGLEVAGSHEPLVSADLFEQVQQVLRRRFRDPRAKGPVKGFPLRGIAICASCRGHMTAGWYKRRFGYYHCSRRAYNKSLCSAVGYTNAKTVHAQVEAVCRKLILSRNTTDAILAKARRLVAKRVADLRRNLNALRARRDVLARRELRLTEAFVAEELAPTAYKTAAHKLRREFEVIDSDIARGSKDNSIVLRSVAVILEQAQSFWDLQEELDEVRRVALLRALFVSVVLDEKGMIGFTLRAPFDAIFTNAMAPRRAAVSTLAEQLTDFVSQGVSETEVA